MDTTSIYVIRVEFTPLRDIIAPPFTSKLSYTMLRELLSSDLRELVDRAHGSREPFKPYRVSLIFNSRGKALFKTPSHRKILVLEKGERYWFTSTIILGDTSPYPLIPKDSLSIGLEQQVDVIGLEISRYSFRDLVSRDAISEFKLNFISPTLLSAKLCLPPRVRVETGFNVYRLFPQPCLWLRSLVLYWNKYAPRELRFRDSYRLCRLGDVLLAETAYNIKPVTVVYGRGGRVIEHRGFVGWVKYRVVEEWFTKRIAPLLRLAEIIGVGRSRSIGFGHVLVEYGDTWVQQAT